MLHLWSRIKKCFVRKKLEIDKTTNKWFEETAALMEKHFRTDSQIDMLCAGALNTACNYCNAAFLLLKNSHKMPAKALLRIMCELAAKLVWCLWVPNENKQDTDDVVYEKFQRWQKATLIKNRKMLESLEGTMPNNENAELNNEIARLQKAAAGIQLDPMPRAAKIFEELPNDWVTIYPVCYKQFNNAVHPDLKTMGDLIKIENNKIICLEDSEDDARDLAGYCLDWAYHINYFIRRHYGWNTDEMKGEYDHLA